MAVRSYEQETGFKKIPDDMWHELCTTCGDVVDIGWVARHRRTHEAERRLVADLKGNQVAD
jgi:hypothetical protein